MPQVSGGPEALNTLLEKVFQSALKTYDGDKGKASAAAWAAAEKAGWHKKGDSWVHGKELENKFSSNLQFKEESGAFVTSGFIATTHPDNASKSDLGTVGDILDESVIDKIVYVMNNNEDLGKLYAPLASYRHDWMKQGDASLPPAGITQGPAEKRRTEDGHWGAWVNTEVLKTHPDYEKIIYDVQHKVLPGYSIEYETTDYDVVNLNGDKYRHIKDLDFYGYAYAQARTIANPQAQIKKMGWKEIKEQMVVVLANGEEEEEKEEKKEISNSKEDGDMEEKKEEVKTEKVEVKEVKVEAPKFSEEEMKEFLAFKDAKKDLEKKELLKKEIKEELVKLMPKVIPALNTGTDKKVEVKELKSFNDSLKTGNLSLMYKEASVLVNKMREMKMLNGILVNGKPSIVDEMKHQEFKCLTDGTSKLSNSLEMKELEMKGDGLETDTNKADSSWTYGTYYQSPVELNDIYSPIIQRHLNDATVTWNLLQKEDWSSYSAIRFRAETAANATAAGRAEGTDFSTLYTGYAKRDKFLQPFCYYYVLVRVTGPELALSEAPGGIGDIYSKEISAATKDLAVVLNKAIIGTGDGTSEAASLGFEGLILGATGTLYGRNIATYTTLKSTKTNKSSAHIKVSDIRAMVRLACGFDASSLAASNAQEADLVIITSGTQYDFLRNEMTGLLKGEPPLNNIAVGVPSFSIDNVPIVRDPNVNADDAFLIDRSHTKVAIKVPASYTEAASDSDWRGGFIKIYFNLYSDAPANNVWYYGFATS